MHRKLNEVLLSESRLGRRLVVVLDEAQYLSDDVLEAVRMLSNFETPREKLMHLVLAGQPSLAEKLASPQLIQLSQRISIIARLQPFTTQETEQYIEHRLRVAGYDFSRPMFTPQALETIAKYSRGIPRNINNVCFNSMSLGFVAKQRTIDDGMVREVIGDLDLNIAEPEAVSNPQPVQYAAPAAPIAQMPAPAPAARPRVSFGEALASDRIGPATGLGSSVVVTLSWLGIQAKRRSGEVLASPARPRDSAERKRRVGGPGSISACREHPPRLGKFESQRFDAGHILPNDTLFEISVQAFGRYDEETLAKIRELNPWLNNPDHIEAGQKIRVPSTSSTDQQVFPKPSDSRRSRYRSGETMSKNFELMQQAEIRLETPAIGEPKPGPSFSGKTNGNRRGVTSL